MITTILTPYRRCNNKHRLDYYRSIPPAFLVKPRQDFVPQWFYAARQKRVEQFGAFRVPANAEVLLGARLETGLQEYLEKPTLLESMFSLIIRMISIVRNGLRPPTVPPARRAESDRGLAYAAHAIMTWHLSVTPELLSGLLRVAVCPRVSS